MTKSLTKASDAEILAAAQTEKTLKFGERYAHAPGLLLQDAQRVPVLWRSKHTGNVNETLIGERYAERFAQSLEVHGHRVLAINLNEAPTDAELLRIARQAIGDDSPVLTPEQWERVDVELPNVEELNTQFATSDPVLAEDNTPDEGNDFVEPELIVQAKADGTAQITDLRTGRDWSGVEELPQTPEHRRNELEALGIVALRKVASALPKERKIPGAWDLKKPALIDAILAAEAES